MSTSAKQIFAFARCDRLKTLKQLAKAQAHAERDPTAKCQVRPGTNPDKDQVRWTLGADQGAFDLVEGWRRAKGSARERSGAPICLHILLCVSPEWVERSGGVHDRDNPANKALLAAARNFAEREIGQVAAARLDLDEDGGGVVDVFVVPTFERQRRLRKDGSRAGDSVMEISVNKAFERLRAKTKERGDYSSLQSAWAGYAQNHLDQSLLRGQRKWMTGRRHLETPEYRALKTELMTLEARATVATTKVEHIESEKRRLGDLDRSLADRENKVAEEEKNYRRVVNRLLLQLGAAWSRRARGETPDPGDEKVLQLSVAVSATSALDSAMMQIRDKLQNLEERNSQLSTSQEQLTKKYSILAALRQKLEGQEADIATQQADLERQSTQLHANAQKIAASELKLEIERKQTAKLAYEASALRSKTVEIWKALERRWAGTTVKDDEELLRMPAFASAVQAVDKIKTEMQNTSHELDVRSVALAERQQRLAKHEKELEAKVSETKLGYDALVAQREDFALREANISNRERTIQAAEIILSEERTTFIKEKERETSLIKNIGYSLGKWLSGDRTPENRSVLNQPEAKPFVDAFNFIITQISSREKSIVTQEAALKMKEKETTERLAKMDADANALYNFIIQNDQKAKNIEQIIKDNMEIIEKFVSDGKMPSLVARAIQSTSEVRMLIKEISRGRNRLQKGGLERD
jgi:peptidoglycan hydrolase CwlO-like protein